MLFVQPTVKGFLWRHGRVRRRTPVVSALCPVPISGRETFTRRRSLCFQPKWEPWLRPIDPNNADHFRNIISISAKLKKALTISLAINIIFFFFFFFPPRRFERAIRKRPNTARCLAVKSTLLGTRPPRKEKEAALQNNWIACLPVRNDRKVPHHRR